MLSVDPKTHLQLARQRADELARDYRRTQAATRLPRPERNALTALAARLVGRSPERRPAYRP